MDLFCSPDCSRSHVVRMYLQEQGIPCGMLPVDVDAARNLDPDFLRMSPEGETPVLVEGENTITNVSSMIRFLDHFRPRLGGDAVDDEVALQWTERLMPYIEDETLKFAAMGKSRAQLLLKFKRKVCVDGMARNPDLGTCYSTLLSKYQMLDGRLKAGHAADVARKELGVLFREIEERLAESQCQFLAGNNISLADILLVVLLARVQGLGWDKEILEECTALKGYWAKWKRRPSYRRVLGLIAKAGAKASLVQSTLSVRARSMTRRYT